MNITVNMVDFEDALRRSKARKAPGKRTLMVLLMYASEKKWACGL
jgi:hypothetical protein